MLGEVVMAVGSKGFSGLTTLSFLILFSTGLSAEVPQAIWSAIDAHDSGKVQKWLAGKPDLNGRGGPDRLTPLHKAAVNKDLPIVKALLAKGADARLTYRQGGNALHLICSQLDLSDLTTIEEIVRVLLGAGAPVDQVDQEGNTPLLVACDRIGFAKDKATPLIGMLLVGGASPDVSNTKGDTPLSLSVTRSSLAMVKTLVEHKAKIDLPGPGKSTAINLAAGWKQLDTVRFLAEAGADANLPDVNGTVPLHNLVQDAKHLELVRLLIHRGADVNARRKDGKTPLALASWSAKFNAPMIKLLQENGAK